MIHTISTLGNILFALDERILFTTIFTIAAALILDSFNNAVSFLFDGLICRIQMADGEYQEAYNLALDVFVNIEDKVLNLFNASSD